MTDIPTWVPDGVARIAPAILIGTEVKRRLLEDARMKRVWPVLLQAENPTLVGAHPSDFMGHWGVSEDNLSENELACAAFFAFAVRELSTPRDVWTQSTALEWAEMFQSAADCCAWTKDDPSFDPKVREAAAIVEGAFHERAKMLKEPGHFDPYIIGHRSSGARGDDEIRMRARILAAQAEKLFGKPCPGAVATTVNVALALSKPVTRRKVEDWYPNKRVAS